MEKVEGQHLLNYISEHGPVNEEDAKTIIKQVIEGLGYMHERGVIHRDMNPTNVFLVDEQNKFVKILDFNVSKLIDTARS
jgi:serine/threonine protein kinase